MNENPGQNEPAFLKAGGASERRLEAEHPPFADETTEDGQEVFAGIDLLTRALGFWVHRHHEERLLGAAAWKTRNPAVNDRIEREKRFLLTAGQDLQRYRPASTLKGERWNG